jgi:hypothetical protein
MAEIAATNLQGFQQKSANSLQAADQAPIELEVSLPVAPRLDSVSFSFRFGIVHGRVQVSRSPTIDPQFFTDD